MPHDGHRRCDDDPGGGCGDTTGTTGVGMGGFRTQHHQHGHRDPVAMLQPGEARHGGSHGRGRRNPHSVSQYRRIPCQVTANGIQSSRHGPHRVSAEPERRRFVQFLQKMLRDRGFRAAHLPQLRRRPAAVRTRRLLVSRGWRRRSTPEPLLRRSTRPTGRLRRRPVAQMRSMSPRSAPAGRTTRDTPAAVVSPATRSG